MVKRLLICILLVIGLSGCSSDIISFLRCGDAGDCGYGAKYGCHGSDKCQAEAKKECLNSHKVWDEEYGFCKQGVTNER